MTKKIKNICCSDLILIICCLLPLLIVGFDYCFTALSYKGSSDHLLLGEFTQSFINQFAEFDFLNLNDFISWCINNLGLPNNSIFLCALYLIFYYVFIYLIHFVMDVLLIIPSLCENFLERWFK